MLPKISRMKYRVSRCQTTSEYHACTAHVYKRTTSKFQIAQRHQNCGHLKMFNFAPLRSGEIVFERGKMVRGEGLQMLHEKMKIMDPDPN